MKKFSLIFLCFFAHLHSDTEFISIYPEIEKTCILKDGTQLFIKENNYCLQENDPEIFLLWKSFPLHGIKSFTVARGADGLRHYFDCLNGYIRIDGKEMLCGTMLYIPLFQVDTVIIEFLAVEPAYQKMGIGKALISCLEETYRERGYKKICLTSSAAAQTFYKKLGYIGSNRDFSFEKDLDSRKS